MTSKREWASSRAKSPEHFKQLLNEPGQYQQPAPSESYRSGWDRIFGNNKEEENEDDSS